MFIPLPTIPSIVPSDDIQPTMLNVNLGPFKSIRFIVIFFSIFMLLSHSEDCPLSFSVWLF